LTLKWKSKGNSKERKIDSTTKDLFFEKEKTFSLKLNSLSKRKGFKIKTFSFKEKKEV